MSIIRRNRNIEVLNNPHLLKNNKIINEKPL